MSIMMVKKEFKLVGLKGSGEFVNYGNEVPLLAKQLLSRSNEILNPTETEIALFEPKKAEEHRVGHYYVGLIVNEKLNEVPTGMEYIETNKSYITTRGNISNLRELHLNLLNWAEKQGYERDLDSYIVETYHPMGGEEEVQIYLPIQA
ncbi:AraC family transcriptional regulator [Cytobacillus oceanisediminis]|uniref:GyrI-like domain-containing protein n=1 Tax=Bacillaceae TaxID=186817 RepID=UPI000C75A7A6|nr:MULTISPECIES: AraC family transcriptional regulator [Bacillaceae]MBQ6448770.1 AraC family transcriptional regulator [Bacillus sp. (in: firmicutes)]MBZ9532962.1 AraC family transcriptional regulator [Cytobacillus oceanisediminis]UTI40029.1 AraC family transcriptional regulator [Niallia sp. RD1]